MDNRTVIINLIVLLIVPVLGVVDVLGDKRG